MANTELTKEKAKEQINEWKKELEEWANRAKSFSVDTLKNFTYQAEQMKKKINEVESDLEEALEKKEESEDGNGRNGEKGRAMKEFKKAMHNIEEGLKELRKKFKQD